MDDVLGILVALILVEAGDHLTHHELRRIVAQLQAVGNEPDFGFSKVPDITLEDL